MQKLFLVLALLGVTILFALASGFTPFFRLAYVLIGALFLSFLWAWLTLRWLEVTVEQRTVQTVAGGWAEERIRVRNKGWFPKPWFEVHDPSDLPGLATGRVVSFPARGYRSWLARGKCQRRGLYALGPLTATAQDPFGVFQLKRSFGQPRKLMVYPATVPLPSFLLPLTNVAGESRTHRRSHHTTASASSLRDYQPGDAYKRIHWPSTARFSKIMVKEFDLEPSSDYWVVLDLQESAQAGQGDDSTEEYGVAIAASVAKRYLEANLKVGLLCNGTPPVALEAQSGEQQLNLLLEALATVGIERRASLVDSLARNEGKFRQNTTLVVITASPYEGTVTALRHLFHRDIKSVVILLDPSSFGSGVEITRLATAVAANGMPAYLVRRGDSLAGALASAREGSALSRRSVQVGV